MVEAIPNQDQVSRHIDSPHKWNAEERRFVDESVFMFSKPDEVESVVWRKYAPSIEDVHALGCARQAEKRKAGRAAWTYQGAITATAGAIRAIVNGEGDRFEVVHAPDEGQYHAHVEYRLIESTDRIRQRKSDLKELLRAVFSELQEHACTE